MKYNRMFHTAWS